MRLVSRGSAAATNAAMDIICGPVPQLPTSAEIGLLRDGLARHPASTPLRDRLAELLIKTDAFAEAIALLMDPRHGPRDWSAQLRLVSALFSRGAKGDAELAADAARWLVNTATSPADRAIALADLGRAQLAQGDAESAIALAEQAIALWPADARAVKLLATEWLRRGEADRLIALTDQLISQGIVHARVLAARSLALAAAGQTAAAQALVGATSYVHAETIAVPQGWADLSAFNAALAGEIMANPDRRFDRYGTASRQTWRVDDPAQGDTPAVDALLTHIAGAAAHYAASLSGAHVWLSARPAKAILQNWCVITEGAGHERWHMHPDGWLSGGYYAAVPDAVVHGDGEAGCLAFGLPDRVVGTDAATAFGQTLVRPSPGLLTLFPSHAHHRTFAHGSAGTRMCIAFDVCPA